MSLDLSKFKKVEDGKDVAILQHPDGHKIEIVKNVLNKKYSKDLNKLPLHMADGGEVKEEDKLKDIVAPMKPTLPEGIQGRNRMLLESTYVSPEIKASILKTYEADQSKLAEQKAAEQSLAVEADRKKAMAAQEYNQMASKYGLAPAAVPNVPPMAEPGTLVASADNSAGLGANVPSTQIDGGEATIIGRGPQQPSAVDQYGATMATGLQSGLLGVQQEAKALGDLGKQQANIYQQEIDQQQKLNNDINTKMAEYETQNKALIDSIQKGQVDPNRFLSSMGTGQKVALNIGLILGGIGAGMTGGPNIAQQMLMKNIDNDIEAQKTELGKKTSLLSYNMQHFGNIKDAIAMTKAQMVAMTDAKIKQAAAAASDPIAKARAMQASSELISKQNDILKGIATNQTLQQAAQSGAAKGNPVDIIKLKVPESQQGKYYEELQKAQNANNALTLAENAYDEMKRMSRMGALVPGSDAKTAWNAKKEEIAINLAEALGEKAERLKKSIDEMLPERLFESDDEIDIKKKSMRNLLQRNMSFPLLDSIGVNAFTRKMIQERAPKVK